MTDVKEKMYKIWDIAMRCIYPERCSVCNEIIPINKQYCACSCDESTLISEDCCFHCGHSSDNCICEAKNSVYLPKIAGVYIYGGKVRSDILKLKIRKDKIVAARLGTAMAERCAKVYCDIDFDLVSFVPMSQASFEKRGYNQSQLLANRVGELLFLPVEDLLDKIRMTKNQHDLSGEERLTNVENSVRVKVSADVKGKNILICDDVKTTGATLNQCVENLKRAGAAEVCCICAAITDFYL